MWLAIFFRIYAANFRFFSDLRNIKNINLNLFLSVVQSSYFKRYNFVVLYFLTIFFSAQQNVCRRGHSGRRPTTTAEIIHSNCLTASPLLC